MGIVPGQIYPGDVPAELSILFLIVKTVLSVTKVDTLVVIERAVFRHRTANVMLVADAYRGKYIWQSLYDFIFVLSNTPIKNQVVKISENEISAGLNASLVIFLGHNGLMDFQFEEYPPLEKEKVKDCIVLCSKSRQYFSPIIKKYNANTVLLTEQLMYPGAMVLEAAIEGWIKGENKEMIRIRAAESYAKNQGISVKSAKGIFSKL